MSIAIHASYNPNLGTRKIVSTMRTPRKLARFIMPGMSVSPAPSHTDGIPGTLQAEDYALLIGSLGLFFVVTLLMVLTRKIDWYAAQEEN